MKILFGLIISFCCFFIYGIAISQWETDVVSAAVPQHPPGLYDYRGITNVHSSLNQGSGKHSDIIQQAKDAGLDFVFITDLNQFEVPHNLEGYHSNLLVLFAGQYSYLDSRLLFFNQKKEPAVDNLGEMQVVFTDLLSQKNRDTKDGFIVLSHPFMRGFHWSGEYDGLDGIEILNLRSMSLKGWQDSPASFVWSLLVYPFNPRMAILRLFNEPSEELELWDKLNAEGQVFGMAGSQATAKAVLWPGKTFQFPSYKALFEIVSNHVLLRSELTGNVQNDKSKILAALRQGNFYMSFDLLGNPMGFTSLIEDGDRNFLMGETVRFSKKLVLTAALPMKPKSNYELVVYKDGQRYFTVNEPSFEMPITEPGVYRVTVRVIPTFPLPDGKKWLTWIYTNPFHVKP